MSFWNKLRFQLQKFMTGRHGADQLSLALLVTAILLTFISSFTGVAVLNLLSLVAYGYCIFRMFSKNLLKRSKENAVFVKAYQDAIRWVKQTWNRLKNIRKYKYFRCPECKSLLRLPRKVGEVTVTCGKCHHSFKQKA